ncbi:MAG: DoxX family protein [Bacteroidota bacterium]
MIAFLQQNQQNALSIIRILVGLLMIYHGWEVFDTQLLTEYSRWDQFKSFPNPQLIVTAGKAIELISGLSLALGLFARLGAILLIMSMLFITFTVGKGQFWYADQHPFLFVLIGIIYLFFGAGKFSLDIFFNRGK